MGMTEGDDPLVAAMAVLATEGFAHPSDAEKAEALRRILAVARRLSIEGASASDKDEAIARVLGAWSVTGIKYQPGRSPAQALAYLHSALHSRWLDETRRRKRALAKLRRAHGVAVVSAPAPDADEAIHTSALAREPEFDRLHRLLETGIARLRDDVLPKVLERKRSGHATTRQGFEDRVAIAMGEATQYGLAKTRVIARDPTAAADALESAVTRQMATQTKAQDRAMSLMFSELGLVGGEGDPVGLAYKAALFVKARRSARAGEGHEQE